MPRKDKHTVAVNISANTKALKQGYKEANRLTDAHTRKVAKSYRSLESIEKSIAKLQKQKQKRNHRDYMRQVKEKIRAQKAFARGAEKAYKREERAIKRIKRAREQAAKAQVRRRKELLGRGKNAVMGRGKRMLGAGAAALGGIGLLSVARQEAEFRKKLTLTRLNASESAQWEKKASQRIKEVSDATGVARKELLSFTSAFVSMTGEANFPLQSMEMFAKLAAVSGSSMEELSASLEKVVAAGVDVKDLPKTMAILYQQTKQGSITMDKLSQVMPKILPMLDTFGQSGPNAVRALGGLTQISARAFKTKDPNQVGTSSERFLQFVGVNRKKIEKAFGIKLADVKGNKVIWKPLGEVFKLIGKAVAGNQKLFQERGKEFFGQQGIRVAQQLGMASSQGWKRTVGSRTAASNLFGATGKDEKGKSALEADYDKYLASSSAKLTKHYTRIMNSLAEHMGPALESLADAIPTISKGIKFFLDHLKEVAYIIGTIKALQFTAWLARLLNTFRSLRSAGGDDGGEGGGGKGRRRRGIRGRLAGMGPGTAVAVGYGANALGYAAGQAIRGDATKEAASYGVMNGTGMKIADGVANAVPFVGALYNPLKEVGMNLHYKYGSGKEFLETMRKYKQEQERLIKSTQELREAQSQMKASDKLGEKLLETAEGARWRQTQTAIKKSLYKTDEKGNVSLNKKNIVEGGVKAVIKKRDLLRSQFSKLWNMAASSIKSSGGTVNRENIMSVLENWNRKKEALRLEQAAKDTDKIAAAMIDNKDVNMNILEVLKNKQFVISDTPGERNGKGSKPNIPDVSVSLD